MHINRLREKIEDDVITEWLPVSSTGHMIILDAFLQLQAPEAFRNVFLVVIQLGAILAVIVLFWDRIGLGVLVILLGLIGVI